MNEAIVLATPHRRHNGLELFLRGKGLEVLRLRSPSELTLERLEAIRPRYIFLPHWSWIIPPEIFTRYECIVFHMTDLPYGRGGSPLQNLIVRGHQSTVVAALRCVAELDAGPVYLKYSLSLLGSAEEIFLRAADVVGQMILAMLKDQPTPVPQSGEVTQFKRRCPEDGNLGCLSEISQIHDFIRMLDAEGYPSAFLETNHFRFEFSRASLTPDGIIADVRIKRKFHE